MRLLLFPERRLVNEAWVWFCDGFLMLRRSSALWAKVIFLAMLAFFLLFYIGAMSFSSSPLFLALWVSAALQVVQVGFFYICQCVMAKKEASFEDFKHYLWQKKQVVLGFIAFYMALELFFALLSNWWFTEPLLRIEEGNILFAESSQLWQFFWFSFLVRLLVLALTWALLPLWLEFSDLSFKKVFLLHIQGIWRNIFAFVLLFLLFVATVFMVVFLLGFIFEMSALLGNILLLLFVFWAWPFVMIVSFSSMRHIFAVW